MLLGAPGIATSNKCIATNGARTLLGAPGIASGEDCILSPKLRYEWNSVEDPVRSPATEGFVQVPAKMNPCEQVGFILSIHLRMTNRASEQIDRNGLGL